MSEPIFKNIFGDSWNDLPIVMQKHYANRPFSNDVAIADGVMNISFGKLFKLFSPLFRLLKLLAPYQGNKIPTRVTFASEIDSKALNFNREFFFPNQQPVKFFSKMIQIKDNELIELMRCKIGWRFTYSFENDLVLLKHRGYNLFLFGIFIPLPITFLVGRGDAFEKALSDDEFQMQMTITHFLFGKIYQYDGNFKMTKNIT